MAKPLFKSLGKSAREYQYYLIALAIILIIVGSLGIAQQYGAFAPAGKYTSPSPTSTPESTSTQTQSYEPEPVPEGTPITCAIAFSKANGDPGELGVDYIECPTKNWKGYRNMKRKYGLPDDSKYCCNAKTEKCCGKDTAAMPVCCEISDKKEICSDAGALGKIFGKRANMCYQKTDTCEKPNHLCVAGAFTRCCKSDEDCGYQSKVLNWIPTCLKKSCSPGEKKCPSNGKEKFKILKGDGSDSKKTKDKGYICCEKNQVCTEERGVYACITTSCAEGETVCEGVREFGSQTVNVEKGGKFKSTKIPKAVVCCKENENCFHHPSGYPRCLPKPLEPEPPEPEEPKSPSPKGPSIIDVVTIPIPPVPPVYVPTTIIIPRPFIPNPDERN